MRKALALFIFLLAGPLAQAAEPAPPTGKLTDLVKPTAYRLQFTIDPAKTDFSGHTEIDAELTRAARLIFLHGNGLRVSKAQITAGNRTVDAVYKEVHDSGVARLDLPSELPAGKITLTFDYAADFRTGAEGLFHSKVGGEWYAWTQLQPIDARRMFPGFDEPGFKTPFALTVTAPSSARVFANTPPESEAAAGAMIVHRFKPTAPLPTYLVAVGVGPFDVVDTLIPPNEVRKTPLPFRVIATKGQKPRMRLALQESPKLLTMMERYLGIPYPFEKLDLLSSPLMGGAMENAGLIIQDDALVLLDSDAPVRQLRRFAEVTAHEISHQWFGDLVTPAWWTDIWLNESFAEWLGKKIGHQWRPDLGIAATELEEAFEAMGSDSLGRGRPIRQAITQNRQIASAFDSITYQKGGQVLAMFESFLGPDKFAKGVRLHLERYRFGSATADDFFRSLSEASGDSQIVPAMRTFTDQIGVPLLTVRNTPEGLSISQSRYVPLGVTSGGKHTWSIPVCVATGAQRTCKLLDTASAIMPVPAGSAPLMPNANGAGYYRFKLDDAGWDRLIANADTLPAKEALALADSVFADFEAGGSFQRTVDAARVLSKHEARLPVVELAVRLKLLAESAFTEPQIKRYRQLMRSIYVPRLRALGVEVKRGAHSAEPPEIQALRNSLIPIVALDARDSDLRKTLTAAAVATLDGDLRAVDPGFRGPAFGVAVQELGAPFMTKLRDALVKSNDPLFRVNAIEGLGAADTPQLAEAALPLLLSQGVQSSETMQGVMLLVQHAGTRDRVRELIEEHFEQVMEAFPGFARPALVWMFNLYCSKEELGKLDSFARSKLQVLGGGELELAQAKERIGFCVALKAAKSAEIDGVLAKSPP